MPVQAPIKASRPTWYRSPIASDKDECAVRYLPILRKAGMKLVTPSPKTFNLRDSSNSLIEILSTLYIGPSKDFCQSSRMVSSAVISGKSNQRPTKED